MVGEKASSSPPPPYEKAPDGVREQSSPLPPALKAETSATASDRGTDSSAGAKGGGSEAAAAPPSANADGRPSFSQLMAGAMAPPPQAGGLRPPPPILTVPMVAVPCFLAPAALIESPGFTGQFAMSHQAVLATVTAQAQMQLQASYPPPSELVTSPQPILSTISPLPLQQIPTPAAEITSGDTYHWRKYGQKQVKSSDNSRSYYRCTDSNCFAKKKVERSPDGKIVEVIYGGKHNHDPPQKYKYTKERLAQSGVHFGDIETLERSRIEPNESDPLAHKTDQNSGNETPEQHLYCSSDCEVDAGSKNEEDIAEEPDPKRRLVECSKSPSTPVMKTVREYIVRTEIDARHLSDGYKWRKYGQKIVKGNPNPRSYYRCTHDGCPVRKHVERVPHDAKALLITYEGKHNHDQPSPKYSSDQPATASKSSSVAAVTDEQPSTSSSLSDKKPKEEVHPNNVEGKSADDKELELEGDKALESAQALLSIGLNSSSEGAERTNPEGMNNPLLNENPAAVSVHNS